MPWAAVARCVVRGCALPVVSRGRCPLHRATTTQRGYGIDHQRERSAALPGARCEACGCSLHLERDHRVPGSLGGSQCPANKRWLCRCPEHRCHDRLGVRKDRGSRSGTRADGPCR
jgi:hypothetical protein